MKKTKLLTSLMALVLVVGLGACNESEDDSTTSGDSSSSTETGGNTGGTGTAGDGNYTVGGGIVYIDEYDNPIDDTPVEHHWAEKAEVSADNPRLHVLVCTDEGCEATKVESHQVKANDETYKTGTCTVCGATDLNIEGLEYTSDFEENRYYVSGYDDSWFYEGDSPIDLYIPVEYKGGPVFSVGTLHPSSCDDSPFFLYNDTECLSFIGMPNTLLYIGDYAFYSIITLEEVYIPDNVIYVGKAAFQNDISLSTITLPYGITEVCDYLCNGITNLVDVNLPSTVTSIGEHAFEFCTNLKHIDLPAGVTRIGGYAFADCKGMEAFTVPQGVTELEERTFMECNAITRIELPSTIEKIDEYAFSSCESLETATFPDTLTYFGAGALGYCYSLTSIDFKGNLDLFEEWTFNRCESLESIVIPAGVTSIGDRCFQRVETLKNIFYKGASLEDWQKIDIGSTNNDILNEATVYFYSETSLEGNYWHYVDDVPTVWQ